MGPREDPGGRRRALVCPRANRSPMNITIHHIGIVSRDVQRSVAFYARLLDGRSEPLGGLTVVTTAHVRIAITEGAPPVPPGSASGPHGASVLPPAERPHLIERGGERGAAREDARGRIYARDPDGFTLEFLFTDG